jgi:biopolymer transport protein ExbB
VFKATELGVYLNGNAVMTVPLGLVESAGDIYIGANQAGNQGFVGEMDEVRISKTARSGDWIKLTALQQGHGDKLLAVQTGEQLGAAGSSNGFFSVIFRSTEESGWAIIILCAIMGLISWIVMIGKTLYLGHVSEDNAAFLDQFKSLTGDNLAMLDHEESTEEKTLAQTPIAQAIFGGHDHFQSSPVYHLYHRAIQEVHQRMGRSAGAQAAALTPAAVGAVKAALDAEMMREAQKMNSQMVLLTIAISGGPFLGLLGTVVGVMITFAAIAATGDVNVAAIAPGVAAALLTTVAGLFVAIPALFGYNWLASKIKEAIVDMRMFNDELITRIAETYGE